MAKVVKRSGNEVTVEVTVRLDGTLLEMERAIQEATNEVGCCATHEALGRFDADGSPIRLGEIKLTVRERNPKEYQTPYGPVQVERYIYQGSRGGRVYCPLEHGARIVRGATPLFASQISHKYAQLNVRSVQTDLQQNHGRKVSTSYIQNVAEWVGSIATAKEEEWEYEMPALGSAIATVVVGLDGAMIPMADSPGYREAMAGTVSFYDPQGERRHTICPLPPRPSTAKPNSCSVSSARLPEPSSIFPRRSIWASPTARPVIGASSNNTPIAS